MAGASLAVTPWVASFRGLAAWGGVEEAPAAGDLVGDEARRDRRAVVVHDRDQPRRVDRALVDQKRAQLPVAVLLDHEDLVVPENEVDDLVREGEGAHAQRIERDAAFAERLQRLAHGGRGRAEGEPPGTGRGPGGGAH